MAIVDELKLYLAIKNNKKIKFVVMNRILQ